ncbi:MAG: hydrogenase maturation protease, partial [Anaerolineae bacterium]|nr:hydrogenase maturation protease [Anaerolineae bacterium]
FAPGRGKATVLHMNDEFLPAFCQARVLILGVGNLLFGDDGFGPAVAEFLSRHYVISDDMYVMDVGTGVRRLLFTLALSETQPEEVVIVDAVDWGQEIGQVSEVSVADLPVTKIDDFSLHQVPTSNMLRELQEHCYVKVTVFACDVGEIPPLVGPGLSPKTQQAVVTASRSIAERFSLAETR